MISLLMELPFPPAALDWIVMRTKDPHVEEYIARSADFAKPILCYLRALVHAAGPDVIEGLKWGFPHFDYMGLMCSMAAFKHHCSFSFWKAELIVDLCASPQARIPLTTFPATSVSRKSRPCERKVNRL